MRERCFFVRPELYPFRANWFERNGTAMHYVDEGCGLPVVLLHGNPTWSFVYRDIIEELRGSCRTIAPDYIGFGYSDHPADFGYSPQEHADWIEALLEYLDLRKSIVVVHDWGGPIGLSVAVRRAEHVAGLVILNTWCWPLPFYRPPFAWFFSIVFGGPFGKYLNLKRNFFARCFLPMGIARPEKKIPELRKAYTDPFPTPESRKGTYVFPWLLRKSDDWIQSVESQLSVLREKPVEIVWAMKDLIFGRESFIQRWKGYFPRSHVDRVEDASHFLQEDRPERVAAGVKRLIERVERD